MTMMQGPSILAATLTPLREFPKSKRGLGMLLYRAQYESQSDFHSKAICWAILFDLMVTSPLLRMHVGAGKVGFGVNHEMSDFTVGRKKDLDLVIALPGTVQRGRRPARTFAELAESFEVELTPDQRATLVALPVLKEVPVGSVLVAVEAKATMTAHQKALPRLFDELHSSQATVHGAADQAIAAGLCIVNGATHFLSRDRNQLGVDTHPPLEYVVHAQPRAVAMTLDKVGQLPRRSGPSGPGFDALGAIVIDCRNDGTPVRVNLAPPAPDPSSDFYYDQMVHRIAGHYAYRFGHL